MKLTPSRCKYVTQKTTGYMYFFSRYLTISLSYNKKGRCRVKFYCDNDNLSATNLVKIRSPQNNQLHIQWIFGSHLTLNNKTAPFPKGKPATLQHLSLHKVTGHCCTRLGSLSNDDIDAIKKAWLKKSI